MSNREFPRQASRFLAFAAALALLVHGESIEAHEKARLVVITDIGGDPDDAESLVRLLVYSNEFDIEGLIAVPGGMSKAPIREDMIRERVAAYAKVRDNLLVHAPDFPSANDLMRVIGSGQTLASMAAVGDGKNTSGSRLIVTAANRADARPLWITCWAGTATLAQALLELRAEHTLAELEAIVARLRVYSISDQDDAGPWIRREFPKLFYIVTPSRPMPDWSQYHLATWSGISGDLKFKNGPFYHFDLVDNPWLQQNIIENHGALGGLYPPLKYIMEGDTPSWLGLIDNGLGWTESPAYGGWGGRYVLDQPAGESHPIWTNNNGASRDSVIVEKGNTATSDQATIWRWRVAYQNDFAARMNWCIADSYAKANHNPLPVLNGDRSTDVVNISAKAGATAPLSAEGTTDPGGNKITFSWWIYPEAGTISGATLSAFSGPAIKVQLPISTTGQLHVILEVQNGGTPKLTAYRRAIIEIRPR